MGAPRLGVLLLPVGADRHQFGAVERHGPRRFGEGQVRADGEAEAAPLGVDDGEAEAVAVDLALLAEQVDLAVVGDHVPFGTQADDAIVEDALHLLLDDQAEDDIAVEFIGALGQVVGGMARHALGQVGCLEAQFGAGVAQFGKDNQVGALFGADLFHKVAHLAQVRFGIGKFRRHLNQGNGYFSRHESLLDWSVRSLCSRPVPGIGNDAYGTGKMTFR